ncbi:MAG: DUF1189 domain-containing protein [Vallitaleaceae bacterium]|nr:DUF1189 domain-containing protein [Vallitaleaceae bacterium]
MKSYHFFQRIFHSIRTPEFYLHILKEKTGKAVLYFLGLLLIITSLTGIYSGLQGKKMLNEIVSIVESSEFPDFSFQNGNFDMESSDPIIIQEGKLLKVIIDDTGSSDINDLAGYDVAYLLTDRHLVISMQGQSPNTLDLSLFNGFNLDKPTLAELLHSAKGIILPITIVTTIFISIFVVFFQILFLYLLALFLRSGKKIGKETLSNAQLFSILMYALTPGFILSRIMAFVPILGIFSSLVFFGATIFYVNRALRTILNSKIDITVT